MQVPSYVFAIIHSNPGIVNGVNLGHVPMDTTNPDVLRDMAERTKHWLAVSLVVRHLLHS